MKGDKEKENVIEQIIEEAAKKAKITREQSKVNLTKAFEEIQKHTLEKGEMDLTDIGVTVYSRSWRQKNE